jgi:hypothetical protein
MSRCRQQGGVRSDNQDKAKVIAHLKRKNEVDWLKKWEVVNADGSLGEDPKGLVVSIPLLIQYHVDNVRAYNEEIQTAINWYHEIGGVPTYDQMHDEGFRLLNLVPDAVIATWPIWIELVAIDARQSPSVEMKQVFTSRDTQDIPLKRSS